MMMRQLAYENFVLWKNSCEVCECGGCSEGKECMDVYVEGSLWDGVVSIILQVRTSHSPMLMQQPECVWETSRSRPAFVKICPGESDAGEGAW